MTLKKWIPVVLWCLVVTTLSQMPSSAVPKIALFSHIRHFDKLVHFVMYSTLAWLVMRTFERISIRLAIAVWICVSIYGLAMEVIQTAVSAGRSFEWLDELANSTGAFSACILFYFIFFTRKM